MAGAPESAAVPGATALPSAARALFERSGAAQFGISEEQFSSILLEVGAKYLPPDASEAVRAEFYGALRVEELALARACAAGHELAWQIFLTRFRAKLYDAAGAITHDEASARELADSLYAELYGMGTRDGARNSKLRLYMGRGSLEGWLRTVLAQEYVNRYRAQKRLVSLEEETEAGAQFAAPVADESRPPDTHLNAAIDQALGSLASEDRLLLAAYYLDGRTLAQIARMLGVHESTISRKLDRLSRRVRDDIIRRLLAAGMSDRQAEEALEADVRDITVDIRRRLAQEPGSRSFSEQDTS
jgi:RNA polymerase sigma-70 factor (ECF subfamily)